MPHTRPAFEYLEELAPTLREDVRPRSMLYVGWRWDTRPWWYETFGPLLGIKKFGVLEAFHINRNDFRREVDKGIYNSDVFFGNVLDYDKERMGRWDVIFWDHGPEHVSWEELKEVTPKLIDSSDILLYAAPWGKWTQGAEGGNELERHVNSITVDQFESLGLITKTFGSPGMEGAGEICGHRVNV